MNSKSVFDISLRNRLLIVLCVAVPVALPTSLSGQTATVSAGSAAQAISLISSQQDFGLHVRATFSQNPDEGFALTQGSTQDFDYFAVTIRAYGNLIHARQPTGYTSTGFPFTPGVPVDFIITGNIPQGIFSAWMASRGQPYTQIASNVGFRQSGVSQQTTLDALMVWADQGTISVSLVNGTDTTYNQLVLSDNPVAFWPMNPTGLTEPDLTGNGNTGTYKYQGGSGLPAISTMPNGDPVAVFNGAGQYLNVPSNASQSMSVPTTGYLTLEAWLRPDANGLQFPNGTPDGYVSPMGKCDYSSPGICEWELRIYSTNNLENPPRPNRLSGYVFNPTGGRGAGAYWQPANGVLHAGQWLHVVVEYTTNPLLTPTNCPNASSYPGAINIWVNGIKWNQIPASPTGCMSDPNPNYTIYVNPKPNNSPVNIGTMEYDSWFLGAIGKVAIYNYQLSEDQIASHYTKMTGNQPTGTCTMTSPETCSF
jgi:hypothetical protein